MQTKKHFAAVAAALAIATPSVAQDATILTAQMINPASESMGMVQITVAPHGLLVHAEITGLAPGAHAFNLHETGICNTAPPARPEDPDIFEATGGHINPEGTRHGFLRDAGPHAGDMPNLIVPDTGMVTVEFYVPGITLEMLMDEDGSAVVIRENPDDYLSGSAGARIGCGVFELPM